MIKKTQIALIAFIVFQNSFSFAADDCFKVQSVESGWQSIDAMPGYGIKGDIIQFTSSTQLVFWAQPNTDIKLVDTGESKHSILNWRFSIANSANKKYRYLKVAFKNTLGGLKVDAFANTENGPQVRLLDESRIFSDSISVKWPDMAATRVQISIHVHLHKKPILKDFMVGTMGLLVDVSDIDPAFKKVGKLFFFNPDGQSLELCRRTKFTEEVPLSLISGKTPKDAKLVAPDTTEKK